MKVLWFSNSPWASTGYGNQTKLILPRLAERYGPENVACASNFGHQGTIKRENGIRHYPMGWHPHSDDVAPIHARHHFGDDAGWVITLYDVWVFQNPLWRQLNVASYCPVDHDPVPPKVEKWFKESGAVPIAMSKFGRDRLESVRLQPLYAPHGIDTAVFRPVPADKATFEIPEDRFIVGMVAHNKGNQPPRKGFGEAFLAFSRFRQHRPDAYLYVHSDDHGAHNGVDLIDLAEDAGIPPDAIGFTDGYSLRIGLPDDRMAQLYAAFDVLISPSYGEGFGIPVMEAQACGVPVIVNDFSAQSELCGPGSWKVPNQPLYDHLQRSWFGVPSIGGIVDALVECAEQPEHVRAGRSTANREFACGYDIETVWRDHWEPVMRELEGRLPGSFQDVTFAGPVAA